MDAILNYSKAQLSYKLRELGVIKRPERMAALHVAGTIGFLTGFKEQASGSVWVEGIYPDGTFAGSTTDYYPAFSVTELACLMNWITQNTEYPAIVDQWERWHEQHQVHLLDHWHNASVLAELVIDAIQKNFLTGARALEILKTPRYVSRKQPAQ